MRAVLSLVTLIFAFSHFASALNEENVFVGQLFTKKIDPEMFNWTFDSLIEQFTYRASKKGYPDLPSWLNYMYSTEYHAGFLFGTPPAELKNQVLPIEIIALDTLTYNTRRITLNLMITQKQVSKSIVQMKIDNLNWIHIMDPGRVETLKNIFRRELWPESMNDLELVFMDSAVKLGARRPMNPQEEEGVVVHLGSAAPFSVRLLELQQEVNPLYKISSCPFKRTSIETTFQSSGFKLDWCSFRIIDELEQSLVQKKYQSNELSQTTNLSQANIWEPLSKEDLLTRNYTDELAISICVPGVILTLLIALLTIILCFEHEKFKDESSDEFLENLFNVCVDFFRPEKKAPTVQMVQYSTLNNQPTTTLKSLREITPNHFVDNISLRSASPTGSVFIDNSPLPAMRPLPPPYPQLKTKNGVHI